MSYGLSISLESVLFTAIGQASMCWSEIPKGVFDSEQAVSIGHNTVRQIEQMIDQILEQNNNKTVVEETKGCSPNLFHEQITVCEHCGTYSNEIKPASDGSRHCCPFEHYINLKKYIDLQKGVVKSAIEQHKQQHQRIKDLDIEVFNLVKLNEKLTGIVNDLQGKNKALKNDVELMTTANQSYHENNMKLINESNQLQSENSDLKNQVHNLKKEGAKIRIYARRGTRYKVAILCDGKNNLAIMDSLNDIYGKDWVACDDCDVNEGVFYTDDMLYEGFSSCIKRYSDAIFKLNI